MSENDKLRLKVAELINWRPHAQGVQHFAKSEWQWNGRYESWLSPPYSAWPKIPHFPTDLNACAELEKLLHTENIDLRDEYAERLTAVASPKNPIFASAMDRTRAFILTASDYRKDSPHVPDQDEVVHDSVYARSAKDE